MAGQNVVVGVDIDQPLALPAGACLDVLAGRDRNGQTVFFARCYHVKDTFKDSLEKGATFCGRPMLDWLSTVGVKPQDVWDETITETIPQSMGCPSFSGSQKSRRLAQLDLDVRSGSADRVHKQKHFSTPIATVPPKWPYWPIKTPFFPVADNYNLDLCDTH